MLRSSNGWLTKDEIKQLNWNLHLGDRITITGRLEKTAKNDLLFVLFQSTTDVSWESIHPGRGQTYKF
jgi:hypothetical protein